MPRATKLVIVESPTKVKSISKYLGDDYEVLASVGHIRDLVEPKNLPPELKQGSMGKFSVDVDNGFEPYYVVSDSKKKTVTELKRALKDADELILATDEDREGEAIAWHLLQVLKPKVPVKRMVFHEITEEAIQAAKDRTRDVDDHLVDAQETRRILDRLYGYEVSPVLWRKVGPGLSAGRVQSAATRLVVDRERERLAFVTASYWGVDATLGTAKNEAFPAHVTRVGDSRIATGRDFTERGQVKGDALVLGEAGATAIAQALTSGDIGVRVEKLETKPYTRRPSAPFTTSTLQQEAGRKLRFTSRQTMSVAQSLYENGHITYMRTDSTALSSQAVNAARTQASELYGADSVPSSPRMYGTKSKGAQEAHEAIRPSGSVFATPDSLRSVLSPQEHKLYDLIWKRTIASQMADAKGQTATVTIRTDAIEVPDAQGTVESREVELQSSGTVITFRGFLAAYEEGSDDENAAPAKAAEDAKLPVLKEGEQLSATEAEPKPHETTPPARYTEASLIKRLDELGIGRPSTYSAIIGTIQDRGYVTNRGSALVPSWTAFSVVRLLEEHFHDLVEYDFTAAMEADLDRIAAGEQDRVDWLNGFYFGTEDHRGLRGVVDNLGEIDAREINSTRIDEGVTLRIGRYGPYLEVASDKPDEPRRISIPEDMAPDELTAEKARELIDAPVTGDRELGEDPDTGHQIVVKDGRFGPYVTEVLPEPESGAAKKSAPKPRTASLFRSMTPAEVTLQQALQLLNLPRVVGVDEETGEETTAQNGRYGPYLKRGTDTRTLPSEEEIFTIDMAGANELFAQPKYASRQSKTVIKELEADPVSGKTIRVKDGRFGPYVTDGETNVTVPRGQNPEEVTFERAVEMLAEKRAKSPAKKKATTRKTTAKKPAAKTGTKAAASKSGTTRKPPANKTTASASKTTTRSTAAKKAAASDATDEA